MDSENSINTSSIIVTNLLRCTNDKSKYVKLYVITKELSKLLLISSVLLISVGALDITKLISNKFSKLVCPNLSLITYGSNNSIYSLYLFNLY